MPRVTAVFSLALAFALHAVFAAANDRYGPTMSTIVYAFEARQKGRLMCIVLDRLISRTAGNVTLVAQSKASNLQAID